MPRISALSTEVAASTSDVIANVGSTTRRLEVQQLLGAQFTSQGQLPYAAGADASTFLAPPTSGAVLTFSSASSVPAWSIPTSGAVLVASSLGVPVWRTIGSSGNILQSTGGSPAWVNAAGVLTFGGRNNGSSVVANSTVFMTPFAGAFDTPNRHIPVPRTGTLRNLYLNQIIAAPGTSAQVFTLMVNDTTRAMEISRAGGATSGVQTDLINQVAVTAGDLISFRWQNLSSIGSSAFEGWSVELAL